VQQEQRKQQERRMRVLFWGMFGSLSRVPLEALLQARHELVGVVVPDERAGVGLRPVSLPQRPIPLLGSTTSRCMLRRR
jgi:hypothetical protein